MTDEELRDVYLVHLSHDHGITFDGCPDLHHVEAIHWEIRQIDQRMQALPCTLR